MQSWQETCLMIITGKSMKEPRNNKFTVREDEDGDYKIDVYNLEMHMDFEVSIPKDISLNINTINGDIFIAGFKNQTDINTISGFIDLNFKTLHHYSINIGKLQNLNLLLKNYRLLLINIRSLIIVVKPL